MSTDNNHKIEPTRAPKDKSIEGRPRKTLQKTVDNERIQLGLRTWRKAETSAIDKTIWKRRIYRPILHKEKEDR